MLLDRRRPLLVTLLLGVAIILAILPDAAMAGGAENLDPQLCQAGRLAPDGSRRAANNGAIIKDQIAVFPPRTTLEVMPGQTVRACVGFQNRTTRATTFALSVSDVGVDRVGQPMSTRERLEFGASSWIRLPATQISDLESGDFAWLDVPIVVPRDAAPGSYYGAIRLVDKAKGNEAAIVQQRGSLVTQIFLNIAGSASHSGHVAGVTAPHVIWWDGAKLADVGVLGRLRGMGIAPVHFSWDNEGAYTDVIGGDLVIRSSLGGKVVQRIAIDERAVLRGSSRRFDATWAHGIPIIGRFEPTIEVRDGNGEMVKHRLAAIWVIPAWWYLVATALAIALPVWLKIRQRRRIDELYERLEAAEMRAQGGADFDDDLVGQ